MPTSEVISAKKMELLAYKAKILQEIKYYDARIEEVRSKAMRSSFVEDSDSSDSEEEFSLSIDNGPSASQLKVQQAMLRTCLQATQELTSLQVLQSEVNVLVEDPEIIGEPPVKEPGVWREVTAECRVDLVPFSITFFVHKPDRQFGQLSYRGLRVVPVKSAHEGELSKSVLPAVTRPSDAVEVLKSYAAAQRSRRTSLARLADKYANSLYMEPMPDGGYTLKCADLLEVSWCLQNKWSPIAPFHHRMKFDLEYMDESYIKTITQAHRQLSDPSLETDERTHLLSKIISTCLEAKGPTQELYESMSSDPENAQTFKTRRTTMDQEPEGPGMKKKSEKELMAPPKSLPKKTKPKGKENVVDNRKRVNSDVSESSVKKLKINDGVVKENGVGIVESNEVVPNSDVNMNNVENVKAKPIEKANVASINKETKKVQSKKVVDDSEKGTNNNKAIDKGSVVSNNKESKKVQGKKVIEDTKIGLDKNKVIDKGSVSKPSKKVLDETEKGTDKNKPNNPVIEKNKAVIDDSDKAKDTGNKDKEMAKSKNFQKSVKTVKNVDEKKASKEKVPKSDDSDKQKLVKEKVSKTAELEKNNDEINKEKYIANSDSQKTVAKSKKAPKATESNKKVTKSNPDKEKTNGDNTEKGKNIATTKNKPDSAKTAEGNKNILKEKSNAEKGDKVKSVASVRSKEPTNEPTVENKPEKKVENHNVASAKEKESTKSKLPSTKVNTNVEKTKKDTISKIKPNIDTKKDAVNNQNKPQPNKIIKTTQNKLKLIENSKKQPKNLPSDKNIENTIEKVVERSVAVKRKSNLLDRIDNVTSAKKISKPTNTENSTEKIKKVATENKIQKIAKNVTSKIDSKFKSKLLPGGIKTHTGNTKVLSNIEKQNSDKKSKIPQKKLSAISEALLKKNPLRISPRKIPSKFKSTSDVNKQKVLQKTTSIPRLLKKPVPKT